MLIALAPTAGVLANAGGGVLPRCPERADLSDELIPNNLADAPGENDRDPALL